MTLRRCPTASVERRRTEPNNYDPRKAQSGDWRSQGSEAARKPIQTKPKATTNKAEGHRKQGRRPNLYFKPYTPTPPTPLEKPARRGLVCVNNGQSPSRKLSWRCATREARQRARGPGGKAPETKSSAQRVATVIHRGRVVDVRFLGNRIRFDDRSHHIIEGVKQYMIRFFAAKGGQGDFGLGATIHPY